jgi:hypothetical protein
MASHQEAAMEQALLIVPLRQTVGLGVYKGKVLGGLTTHFGVRREISRGPA